MPTTDDSRQTRLEQLEAAILDSASGFGEPPETAEELSEISARAHQSIVMGTLNAQRSELRVRLHGKGVVGHLVPADQAGSILRKTQLLVRWIGARLRALSDDPGIGTAAATVGIADATRLFLTPQFGAGSLIFDLVADDPLALQGGQPALDGMSPPETLLDRSLEELLSIVTSSETDDAEDLSELSTYVARMGPRVASQLKALAGQVTDGEIDLDLRWSGPQGRRSKASLTRRGAIAMKDAVERNRVKVDELTIDGTLETASTGKDQVRIDTADASYKMRVDRELGVTLGRWLHQPISARVERTDTWHDSGKATKSYKLLSVSEQKANPA